MSLEHLITAYSHTLILYLCKHGMAWEDAEDVMSIVWERTWRHLDTLHEPIMHWLLCIAHRAMIDSYRHTAHRPATVEWPVGFVPADPAPGPADYLDDVGCDAVWRAAIDALAPAQRQCVRLHMAGYSGQEIADQVGASYPAVKMRLHAGRQALRLGLEAA